MNEATIKIISGVLIGVTIIYFFILAILANIRYRTFLNEIRKINPDFKEDLYGLWVGDGGKWMAGEYMFRTPLPINYKSDNINITELIKVHDKIIKIYWVSVITVLPILIIVLNIIN